jgi:hypothetical protein
MRLLVESDMAREARLKQWHKFFSILPRKVTTADPLKDCWVWLETVERKKEASYYIGEYVLRYDYKYRLIEKE